MLNALFRGDAPADGPSSLLVVLGREGGAWGRALGVAGDFNLRVHGGRVTESELSGGALSFHLRMTIEGDSRTPGGWSAAEFAPVRANELPRGRFWPNLPQVPLKGSAPYRLSAWIRLIPWAADERLAAEQAT